MPRSVKNIFVLFVFLSFCFRIDTSAANHQDTIISYIVCDAGADIYQLEGHAALRVQMPGTDIAVNYGLFDFAAPGFVWRFALGHTDYMCGAAPWEWFLDAYRREGRRVTEHRLDLTPAEKTAIIRHLDWNLQPANRVYRYNYVKDNCATRPLAVVERALPDTLILPDPIPEARTFRDIMRHYHRNAPWYQFGIDLALGPGIDYPLTPREKAFAPVLLDRQLPEARTASGRRLVSDSAIAVPAPLGAAVPAPTPWWATPMAFALAILAAAVAVTVRDRRRHAVTRWFDTLLYGLLGLAGCLVFFLIFFSSHEATSPNYLLAWVNPLCLIPAILLWIKKATPILTRYQAANLAALILLSALWPLLPQSANPAIWPLIAADALRSLNYLTLTRHKKHHKEIHNPA